MFIVENNDSDEMNALSSPPNALYMYAGLRAAYLGLSVGDWGEGRGGRGSERVAPLCSD